MSSLGRYELLRPLARGGMADVYLARRRVAGVEKRLVIKRLRRDRGRDPRFLEMFVREAQLSMTLVQQNIVPVFDFGRIGDDVFLAMEHINGKDLGSTLARNREDASTARAMQPLLAAFVAAECCQALEHAHRRQPPVIHRDVTPRNVLLSWDGEVKLADFGIAAVVGQAAGTFGTPGYMAPEQANGETCDARVDVYALGIVLWEALLGDHVRPATERAATLAAARTGELPEIAGTIPAALAQIIARATARAPGDRFATAHEMGEALDGFMVGERSRDGGPTPAKRLADWLRTSWGDDWEDPSVAGAPNAADAIVTFLDDGAEEVRGHTERSIAETAADDPSGPAAEPAKRELPATQPTEAPPLASRRRSIAIAAAMVTVMTAAGVVVWNRAETGHAPVPPDTAAIAAPLDAAVDATELDAPPDAAIDAPADAAIDAPPPIDAAPRIVRPRIDAAAGSAAPGVLRPITIGAVPWAYFTVDGDPKQHETPVTLRLSVGPHRLTFSNPQLGVSRTVTVTVPAEGDARHVEKMN